MFRNMAGNLVLHEQIKTTDAKAKELRRIAERLLTKALRLGDDLTVDVAKVKDEAERERILSRQLHARREVARFLPKRLAKTHPDGTIEEVDLIHKLFTDIAPRYIERVRQMSGGRIEIQAFPPGAAQRSASGTATGTNILLARVPNDTRRY